MRSSCEMLLLDKKTENEIYDYLPNSMNIDDLSSLYGVFADPTRLKILSVLSLSELCVTDISRLLKINQTTVSHQLHTLTKVGLVRSKRQGKIKFYKIADSVVSKLLYHGVEYLGY